MSIQWCSKWLFAFVSVSVLTIGCDGVEDTTELEAIEDDAQANGVEVLRVGFEGLGDLKSPEAPSFAGSWCCDSCSQSPTGAVGCSGCTPQGSGPSFCGTGQTYLSCAGTHTETEGRVTCY